jgi:hypothetical protein
MVPLGAAARRGFTSSVNLGFQPSEKFWVSRAPLWRVSRSFAGGGTYCGTCQGPRALPMVVFRGDWMHLDLDWILSWDANTRKCIPKRLGSNPIEYPRVPVDWIAFPSFGRWGRFLAGPIQNLNWTRILAPRWGCSYIIRYFIESNVQLPRTCSRWTSRMPSIWCAEMSSPRLCWITFLPSSPG